VYNHGGGILENCDSPRYMIHHVAGYVTCIDQALNRFFESTNVGACICVRESSRELYAR
jgi:hypothetical protein